MSNAAIEALVEEYFMGMYEGDVNRLKAIFHSDCRLFGERKGEKREFPGSDFLAYVAGAPVPKDEGEAYEMELVSINRTGPVAVVHVRDLYQGGRFTDYLTVFETVDGWKIVNKAFYSAD
jgi:hypothetical protein